MLIGTLLDPSRRYRPSRPLRTLSPDWDGVIAPSWVFSSACSFVFLQRRSSSCNCSFWSCNHRLSWFSRGEWEGVFYMISSFLLLCLLVFLVTVLPLIRSCLSKSCIHGESARVQHWRCTPVINICTGTPTELELWAYAVFADTSPPMFFYSLVVGNQDRYFYFSALLL